MTESGHTCTRMYVKEGSIFKWHNKLEGLSFKNSPDTYTRCRDILSSACSGTLYNKLYMRVLELKTFGLFKAPTCRCLRSTDNELVLTRHNYSSKQLSALVWHYTLEVTCTHLTISHTKSQDTLTTTIHTLYLESVSPLASHVQGNSACV